MSKRLEFLEAEANKHQAAANKCGSGIGSELAIAGAAGYVAFRFGVDGHHALAAMFSSIALAGMGGAVGNALQQRNYLAQERDVRSAMLSPEMLDAMIERTEQQVTDAPITLASSALEQLA